MKKILTLLLVAIMASAAVFAGVSFSGSFTAGYNANYKNDEWKFYPYGDDDDGTEDGTLKLKVSDDDGIWSANVMAIDLFDDSGDVDASLSVNFAKAIASALNTESPVDVSFSIGTHRYTTLRAYSNISGNNWDRVRSVGNGYITALQVGYGDLIQIAASIDPGSAKTSTDGHHNYQQPLDADGNPVDGDWYNGIGYAETRPDFTISALTKPVDGIAVSVDFAYNGEDKSDDGVKTNPYGDKGTNGVFGAAADFNIGTIAGLGFDLGVSVAERYQIEDKYNVLAATVYGGVDMVTAYAEYALRSNAGTNSDETYHYLHVGADFALVENMNLDVYFGADDILSFADTYHFGGNVGYTLAGVKYNLGIEYAKGGSYNYNNNGLSIVPSISVSF